jgi:hypothetical protein
MGVSHPGSDLGTQPRPDCDRGVLVDVGEVDREFERHRHLTGHLDCCLREHDCQRSR